MQGWKWEKRPAVEREGRGRLSEKRYFTTLQALAQQCAECWRLP